MDKKAIAISLIIFIGGFFAGRFLFNNSPKISDSEQVKEVRLSGYKFINPLLECEYNKSENNLNGLDPLRDNIDSYIKNQESKKNITDAAVYFRDLNNGPWFGINEHADFSPASLLKLPVMMAYFKKAEDDPGILSKEIYFSGVSDQPVQIFSKPVLSKAKKYQVRDLMEKMITYSDNDALSLLEYNIDNASIDKVTRDLGVETANENTPEDYMSVKGYAGLFRILFNASYLSPKYSEEALKILSETQFDKGMLAGLPKDIMVSHKYGERELPDGAQLHECGIIYYPYHPYLLCIMTRGNDYNKLASVIENVSRTVYHDLDQKYKKN